MANVIDPIRYDVGVPNVNALFQPLSEGITQAREQRAQAQQNAIQRAIGQRLSSGDTTGAADTAFQVGDIKTGLDIRNMAKEEKQQALDIMGRYAAIADTPEKWAKTVLTLAQSMGGQQFLDEYGGPTGRDKFLAETMSLKDQLSVSEAQAKAAKAPDVIELFDPATGQPMKATWDAQQGKFVPLGGPKAPSKGIQVRTNPDGSMETIIGGSEAAGTELGKAGQTTIQGKAINAAEMGSRIAGIMKDYKPEYQTLGTRLGNLWRGTKAKIDPSSLSSGDRQQLTDFAKYRSQAIGNVNRLLNELSGAAVSPAEGERLKAEVPNPGTGIFDGDDPVTFQAKMESVQEQVQRALKRYEFYQTSGLPGSVEDIPLNDVRQVNGRWAVKRGDEWFWVGNNAP